MKSGLLFYRLCQSPLWSGSYFFSLISPCMYPALTLEPPSVFTYISLALSPASFCAHSPSAFSSPLLGEFQHNIQLVSGERSPPPGSPLESGLVALFLASLHLLTMISTLWPTFSISPLISSSLIHSLSVSRESPWPDSPWCFLLEMPLHLYNHH